MSYEVKCMNEGGSVSRFECKSIMKKLSSLMMLGGALAAGMVVGASSPAQAQTEQVLYSFNPNNGPDGYSPYSGVTADKKGNLYGTTYSGGTYGAGTVYKISPSGTETILYNFTGGTDGASPYYSGVVLDKAGNLYGTTYTGGAYGYGVVFKLDASGNETVLHSFNADGTDGFYPYTGVVLDKLGNMYGATYQGGATGYGTVYEVTAAGVEKILYNFQGGTDGCYPYYSGVVIGPKGALYGTTSGCGANSYGTVYEVSKTGKLTVLHSFNNDGVDGIYPMGNLTADKKGNVYGTTSEGGANSYGTVFKITPAGAETILHNFNYDGVDGAYPYSGVALDKLGNLYGTTYIGGANYYGTVYKVDTTGAETVLHNFNYDGTDGAYPWAGVMLGKKNILYGTTTSGGTYGYGAVYKVTP